MSQNSKPYYYIQAWAEYLREDKTPFAVEQHIVLAQKDNAPDNVIFFEADFHGEGEWKTVEDLTDRSVRTYIKELARRLRKEDTHEPE